jgi:hypothetical protein
MTQGSAPASRRLSGHDDEKHTNQVRELTDHVTFWAWSTSFFLEILTSIHAGDVYLSKRPLFML